MEVDVEDLAVAAPVAAEVEDDALVFGAGLLEGGGDVGFGIGFGGVEMLLDRGWGGDGLTFCGFGLAGLLLQPRTEAVAASASKGEGRDACFVAVRRGAGDHGVEPFP